MVLPVHFRVFSLKSHVPVAIFLEKTISQHVCPSIPLHYIISWRKLLGNCAKVIFASEVFFNKTVFCLTHCCMVCVCVCARVCAVDGSVQDFGVGVSEVAGCSRRDREETVEEIEGDE